MTNIVAAVTVAIVTNVSVIWPTHTVGGPYPPGSETLAVYICHQEPDANPTNKTEVWTISQETVLKFDWLGQERAVTNLVALAHKEVKYHKTDRWEQDK